MWDIRVDREGADQNDIRLRTVLARAVAERLPRGKELVRVVGWSVNAGGLFASKPGDSRFAVAYEARVAA